MVYKRKARVLFVGSGDTSRALMAVAFAHALGERHMTARALGLQGRGVPAEFYRVLDEAGLVAPEQNLDTLSTENLAWADLVVTLDEVADQACGTLPGATQKRFYPIDVPENLASLRQARDAIRRRVAGMLGGMAMIA